MASRWRTAACRLCLMGASVLLLAQLALAQPSDSRPKKLDGATRAKAMAALGGLAILGVALMAFTWMGARMTRRYMRLGDKTPKLPTDPVFTDDWASKPLTPQERARLDRDDW